jgi:hypothetical protein
MIILINSSNLIKTTYTIFDCYYEKNYLPRNINMDITMLNNGSIR